MNTIPGLKAAASLATSYQKFVKPTGTTNDFTVSAVAANTDRPIGVLTNKPSAAGQAAEVVGPGTVTKLSLGGTVVAGDPLGPDGDGDGVALVYGTDTSKYVSATALEDGVSGNVIMVLVGTPHRAS